MAGGVGDRCARQRRELRRRARWRGPGHRPRRAVQSNSTSTDNNYRFRGGRILEASALGGLVLVVVGTGANVLLVVLYNLISDVVGGVEITVLEEDTSSRPVI